MRGENPLGFSPILFGEAIAAAAFLPKFICQSTDNVRIVWRVHGAIVQQIRWQVHVIVRRIPQRHVTLCCELRGRNASCKMPMMSALCLHRRPCCTGMEAACMELVR